MLPFPLAQEPDHHDLEQGRLLFAGETEFVKGVVAMSGLPDPDRLEVCFAGRSNVGKSSLINALTGMKALARASNTPGRTQEINFFTAGAAHYLVDLPGYGYANSPLPVVEKWQRLLKQYLSGRQTLRRAFVYVLLYFLLYIKYIFIFRTGLCMLYTYTCLLNIGIYFLYRYE